MVYHKSTNWESEIVFEGNEYGNTYMWLCVCCMCLCVCAFVYSSTHVYMHKKEWELFVSKGWTKTGRSILLSSTWHLTQVKQ